MVFFLIESELAFEIHITFRLMAHSNSEIQIIPAHRLKDTRFFGAGCRVADVLKKNQQTKTVFRLLSTF